MTSRVAFPTLVLADECVRASEWEMVDKDGATLGLGEYLPDWDYSVPIAVRRTLELDWDAVTQSLECGRDIRLAAVLKVGTGSGRLPRSIIHQARKDLSEGETRAEFDLVLHGDALSSLLDLTIDIIVNSSSSQLSELSPRREGSRIWRDNLRMRLEGEEPRFPIEVADFSTLLGQSAASRSPWYLHWSPRDWSRDFHGSMRLYLNADHPDLVAKVEAEDADTLRSLMSDVMGQVCESLVRDSDAIDHLESCEEGSLGRQALRWLDLAFPGRNLDQARSVIEGRPGEFRAAIQAIADMGGADA